jgi:hypothetical protein
VNKEPTAAEATGAWTRFWFTPVPTTGLHCLRVLAGLLFFCWLLSFVGHQKELFSMNGWIDAEALTDMQRPELQGPEIQRAEVLRPELRQHNQTSPTLGWSIFYLAGADDGLFQTLYWGALGVFAAFALGIATRITSVLTWIIVASFLANPATSYEGDDLLAVLAFYLMVGHLLVGQWNGNLSVAGRILGSRSDFLFARRFFPDLPAEASLSVGANLMMRMLQVHFAIIILASALHKLQLMEWLTGTALWYPLHPTLKTTFESLQQEMPQRDFTLFYLSVGGYLVLAWQVGFPAFAWRTGWWRALLLVGAVIGWLGSFLLYGLPLFGPFVVIGCLSFLRPEEWVWGLDRLRSVWRKSETAESALPPPPKVHAPAWKDKIKK